MSSLYQFISLTTIVNHKLSKLYHQDNDFPFNLKNSNFGKNRQVEEEVAGETGTFVNEAGVELHQAGTCI